MPVDAHQSAIFYVHFESTLVFQSTPRLKARDHVSCRNQRVPGAHPQNSVETCECSVEMDIRTGNPSGSLAALPMGDFCPWHFPEANADSALGQRATCIAQSLPQPAVGFPAKPTLSAPSRHGPSSHFPAGAGYEDGGVSNSRSPPECGNPYRP